ncbi:flavodoxin [Leptolinea sp. HRD-7]|nr:flavodoxin [Leptolinea sp. HRD-7]
MLPVEIKPGITWVGVNDRITELFEGLWTIRQEGVSYNSYLIRDDKTVVIDLCKSMLTGEFVTQLEDLVPLEKIDFVVVNHMEPDHTGALRTLIKKAPQVQIIGTAKTRDMLREFYGITENVRAVADGETIDLGHHTLRFVVAPFLHWPETMMTYEEKEQILFSCDAFGSYGALNGSIFDDLVDDLNWYEQEALRYYTNIVAIFPKPVRKALEKLANVPVQILAPSHGLVWRKDPKRIIDLYDRWSNLATEPADPGVTMIYASMYGNSEAVMEAVAQGVVDAGLPLKIFNISKTPMSYILPHLLTRNGVLIGAPTYEGGLFPEMAAAMRVAEGKRMYNRKAAYFGSHAWAGGAEREFRALAQELQWEVLDTFNFVGTPSREELTKAREFGRTFASKLK